jgi:G3E family GTPase
VVSTTDLAAATATEKLIARLKKLNPRAAIDVAVEGVLDPKCLTESTREGDPSVKHFFAEASHSDGITSFVLRDDIPVEWPAFERALETLVALRGPDLLRIKGLLNVAGCRGPVVVQIVQHLAHPPVELAAWPDADHTSRLVFITRGVSEQQVRELFAAVRALGSATSS